MKKFILSFIIPILTFGVGVFIYRISTPKVSLETISNHTWFYDEMNVEIEAFLLTHRVDEFLWTITDFEETSSAITVVYFENDSIKPAFLLGKNNKDQTKRMKVLIKGKIQDNCSRSITCCFGRSITIKAREVKQLAPVEDYIKPE